MIPSTEINKGKFMEKPIYVTEKEVAEITTRSINTLRNDRFLKRGLPYHKVGRLVRYELSEIYTWMQAHKISFED